MRFATHIRCLSLLVDSIPLGEAHNHHPAVGHYIAPGCRVLRFRAGRRPTSRDGTLTPLPVVIPDTKSSNQDYRKLEALGISLEKNKKRPWRRIA